MPAISGREAETTRCRWSVLDVTSCFRRSAGHTVSLCTLITLPVATAAFTAHRAMDHAHSTEHVGIDLHQLLRNFVLIRSGQEEFEGLCFDYGVELDDVVRADALQFNIAEYQVVCRTPASDHT